MRLFILYSLILFGVHEAFAAPTSSDTKKYMALLKAEMIKKDGEFVECYKETLVSNPKLSGKLVVDFDVPPEGRVESVSRNNGKSTLNDKKLLSCVSSVITTIEFPAPPENMSYAVSYPFSFNPQK